MPAGALRVRPLLGAALEGPRGFAGRVTLVDPRSRPTPPSLAPGLLQAMAAHRDVLTYEPFTRVLVGGHGRRRRGDRDGPAPLRLPEPDAAQPSSPVRSRTRRSATPSSTWTRRRFASLADDRIHAVGDLADTPYARTAFTAVSSGHIAGHFDRPRPRRSCHCRAAPAEPLLPPGVGERARSASRPAGLTRLDAGGAPHVKASGSVDNRATPGNLRRRHRVGSNRHEGLFPGREAAGRLAVRALRPRGRSHVLDQSRLDRALRALGTIDTRFATQHRRIRTMTWETPVFVEVRMDAEMTAYADDFDGI